MPDRILRMGILTSDPVNTLSWGAEVFYRRLMSIADDYGRFDGRTVILRASLYPLSLDRVRDSDIHAWIGECHEAELVRLYSCVNGKPHLEIVKFGQRVQSKSKWPDPKDYNNPPLSTVKNGKSPPIRNSDSDASSDAIPQTPKEDKHFAYRLRLGGIFNRRQDNFWDEAEIKKLKKIKPDRETFESELKRIEDFYAAPDNPSDPLWRRTNLPTLLNNWNGELDKASKWANSSNSALSSQELLLRPQ